jgi:thiamine pyrophosphokinase
LQPLTVIVLGAFGGRFDQEIATIHSCYSWRSSFHSMVLLGGENVATLLTPGEHEMRPVRGVEGPTCGLLPVGGPVSRITTEGLQWDLRDGELGMGKLVSSSNCFRDGAKFIYVKTSDPVVWQTTFTMPPAWSKRDDFYF